MRALAPNGRPSQRPKRTINFPKPDAPGALAVNDGGDRIGTIVERDGRNFAFDSSGALIGEYASRGAAIRAVPPLNKQADEILRRANCDTMTGAKMDRQYRHNKRAESRRNARLYRIKQTKLGKFGAASPVRKVAP